MPERGKDGYKDVGQGGYDRFRNGVDREKGRGANHKRLGFPQAEVQDPQPPSWQSLSQ